MSKEMCHCGKPLHYTDISIEMAMRNMVSKMGSHVDVNVDGRTWKVQRHYIALHGLKGHEIESLGFENEAE